MNKFVHYLVGILSFLCLLTQPSLAETVTYYHTDPVGTPLAMTDQSGTKVWEADCLPFGEVYTESGVANARKFVGKERDEESGLDYFGARYHYAKIGRFLAVDPVRAVSQTNGKINEDVLKQPQRGNLYAYSLNNPYTYVDPDGLSPMYVPSMTDSPFGMSVGGGGAGYAKPITNPRQLLPAPKPESKIAYRYVGPREARVAGETGFVPNVKISGKPKDVFFSPGLYSNATAAENALRIGAKNPSGPTTTPTHRITADASRPNWIYGGNVEGGTGIELITREKLKVMKIDRLRK